MPRISSKKVKTSTLKKINKLFVQQIARVRTPTNAHEFFEEFFTPTEQVMFAKRFAAVVMLDRGYSFLEIQRTLRISSSTVARLWREKKRGTYEEILKRCFPAHGRGSVKGKELESMLEVMLRAGMPPIGRGRWKRFYEATEPKKQKKQK